MKNLMLSIVLMGLITGVANAQTYYVIPQFLTAESSSNQLYQTPSGITIKTDKDCTIPDRTPARLNTELKTLVYEVDEPFINLLNEIDYETVEKVCAVLDWMGVAKSNYIVINSNVKYDETHHFLEFNNIRVTDGFQDTGKIYTRATMMFNGQCFDIEEFEQ